MTCCYVFTLLVFSSQNEPPPPYYSVAVHTQPPLKPYEEVVYGVGFGLTPPSHPHYIPQYPPPVVVPTVTRPSIRECSLLLALMFSWEYNGCRCTNKTNGERVALTTVNVCILYAVCVQPPALRRRDAARIMPSVSEGQGEPYCCSVCWAWPSGLEVYCAYSHRSLNIVINNN